MPHSQGPAVMMRNQPAGSVSGDPGRDLWMFRAQDVIRSGGWKVTKSDPWIEYTTPIPMSISFWPAFGMHFFWQVAPPGIVPDDDLPPNDPRGIPLIIDVPPYPGYRPPNGYRIAAVLGPSVLLETGIEKLHGAVAQAVSGFYPPGSGDLPPRLAFSFRNINPSNSSEHTVFGWYTYFEELGEWVENTIPRRASAGAALNTSSPQYHRCGGYILDSAEGHGRGKIAVYMFQGLTVNSGNKVSFDIEFGPPPIQHTNTTRSPDRDVRGHDVVWTMAVNKYGIFYKGGSSHMEIAVLAIPQTAEEPEEGEEPDDEFLPEIYQSAIPGIHSAAFGVSAGDTFLGSAFHNNSSAIAPVYTIINGQRQSWPSTSISTAVQLTGFASPDTRTDPIIWDTGSHQMMEPWISLPTDHAEDGPLARVIGRIWDALIAHGTFGSDVLSDVVPAVAWDDHNYRAFTAPSSLTGRTNVVLFRTHEQGIGASPAPDSEFLEVYVLADSGDVIAFSELIPDLLPGSTVVFGTMPPQMVHVPADDEITVNTPERYAGAYLFPVQYRLTTSPTVTRTVFLRVNIAAPPVLTYTPSLENRVGAPFQSEFRVTKGGGLVSMTITNLPPGVSYQVMPNIGPFPNTLSLAILSSAGEGGWAFPTTAGTYEMEIVIEDRTGRTFTFHQTVVIAGTPLAISPASLPSGSVGVAYLSNVSVSGGTGPYSYAIFSGGLPPGLSFYGTGDISGTPITAGVYSFSVLVSDSAGNSAAKAYSITVL